MNFVSLIFVFAAFICFIKMCFKLKESHEYKIKEKQIDQLWRVYSYFMECDIDIDEAKKNLSTDIVLEDDWLYSEYFFFNLKDPNIYEKMNKYLMEIMTFFLENSDKTDGQVFISIVGLKKELNAVG